MVAKTATKSSSSTMSKNTNKMKSSPPPSSSDKIDSALLERALKALLKHHERTISEKSTQSNNKKNLIGTDDESIQLQITLARVPQDPSPRPIRIDIPHPLHKISSGNDGDDDDDDNDDALEEAEVCLIVKESSKPHIQKLLTTFPPHLTQIRKVLGLDSLRKKYSRFEQRRALLQKYNFFMVDDRILPMVGKQLGKNFFARKKQPVPIKITREEALPFAVEKCLRATYMYLPAGTCLTIKAGYTSMSTTKLLSNFHSILSNAIPKLPKKWANISALSIKTSSSTSLPFYNKTPEELVEIAKLAGVEKKEEDGEVASKRKRQEEEEKMVKEEAKKEKKRQKKELLAVKSPLVRALKKQKQEKEEENKEEEKEIEKEEKEAQEETKSSKKKRKKEKKHKVDKSVENDDKEEKKEVVMEKPKKKKKTKSKTKDDEEPTTKSEKKETKNFIASKKFKGAKSGYAFRMGNEGLGYYIDTPPKPDPMLMDALVRAASSGKSGGGGNRRKSRGAGGGRRKGRR